MLYRKEYSRANQAHADVAGVPLGQVHPFKKVEVGNENSEESETEAT